LEAIGRSGLAHGSDPETIVRAPLRAAATPRPAGYPPAPPVVDRSRLAAVAAVPRQLLGSAVVTAFEVKPALGRLKASRRSSRIHAAASRPGS
jgi:hypothetical protein